MKRLFLIFIFMGSIFFSPYELHALSAGGIGVRPTNKGKHRDWFVYNLGPGESVVDEVVVMNQTDTEQQFLLRAYDSEVNNLGGFALKGPNQEQVGIGKWVEFKIDESILADKTEEEKMSLQEGDDVFRDPDGTLWKRGGISITLGSKEERIVTFRLTIPENADVGEHSGAITVQTTARDLGGGTGVTFSTRVGARIYNVVPGEIIRKLAIVSFSLEENKKKNIYELLLKAKNNGNVSINAHVRFHMEGWGLLSRREVFHSKVFPHDWQLMRGAEVTTSWETPIPYFGKYRFYADIIYEREEGVSEKLSSEALTVVLIPWRDVGIAGIVFTVLILILVAFIVWRRRKYSGRGWEPYKVQEGDSIIELSEKAGIPWKMLVKVNKLKKPYSIKKGQMILLPPKKAKKFTEKSETKKHQTTSSKSHQEKTRRVIKSNSMKKDTLEQPPKDGLRKILLLFIIFLSAVVLFLAGVIFFRSLRQGDERTVEPSPFQEIIDEVQREALPSPQEEKLQEEGDEIQVIEEDLQQDMQEPQDSAAETPEEDREKEIDRTALSIQVLNGSGIPGLASKIAEKLKAAGYTQVTVGNAESFDYLNATIYYPPGGKKIADDIQEVLQDDYSSFILEEAESQESDVVLILGK